MCGEQVRKIGWKLVVIDDKKPKSWSDRYQEYGIGVDTKRLPNHGPLCLMSTRSSARKIKETASLNTRIYKAEYVESADGKVWKPNNIGFDVRLSYPETVYADVIKLLERV